MAWRLLSNPRRALIIGLMAIASLIMAISQRLPDPARATTAMQLEKTKPTSVEISKSSLPANADLPSSDTKKDLLGRDNALWSTPLASLTATRERPIFSLTRRPAPAPVKSAPTQAPSATQPLLALVGAIAGENDGIAIFLDGTTKGVIRLKTGESHAGWTLQAVKAREAILGKEQKTTTLTLPNPPAK